MTHTASRRRPQHHIIDPVLVRERRLALRLSSGVLGELLGVTAAVISHLEHGGEQNHLDVSFIDDLARVLGTTPAELLTGFDEVPGGDGDLVDPEDAATVGRILAEVGAVLVDDLAEGLGWTLGRTQYALLVLAEQLPIVGQRLSWLTDSQVTLIHAPGPANPVQAVTRSSVRAWGLQPSEATVLEWVARKGSHRARGQEVDEMVVSRLKAAGLLTDDVTTNASEGRTGVTIAEQLRFTDAARFNLCLDDTDPDLAG